MRMSKERRSSSEMFGQNCFVLWTVIRAVYGNMEETGLFWRTLPNRTLAKVDKKVKGSKIQKDRATFATCLCMDGSVLPLHGLGTARLPRAVAAANTAPATALGGRWTSNNKFWMNREVFREWLLQDVNRHQAQGEEDRSVGRLLSCPQV
eukprot:scpid87996/ scgid12775/ 